MVVSMPGGGGQLAVPGFACIGHTSQTSPLPSESVSACVGSASNGHLSLRFATPSPSTSFGSNVLHVVEFASSGHTSQASPLPSPSASACAPLSSGRFGL